MSDNEEATSLTDVMDRSPNHEGRGGLTRDGGAENRRPPSLGQVPLRDLRLSWLLSPGAALLLIVAGCNRGPEPTYPVEGVVTVDGVPLEGGSILFEPVEPVADGRYYSARGTIDPSGRYQLSTFAEHDGAIAGKHYVMVFEQEKQLSDDPNLVRYTLIPDAYHTPETTPLTVEVKPEANEIDVPVEGK